MNTHNGFWDHINTIQNVATWRATSRVPRDAHVYRTNVEIEDLSPSGYAYVY